MKRITSVLGAALALLLGSAGTAFAGGDMGCGGGYVAPALSTHLKYRTTSWTIGNDPDGGNLSTSAPKGWSFVHTSQGEGRFHSRNQLDLLSVRPPAQSGTPDDLMAAEVQALAGTSGLKVVSQQDTTDHGHRWATLTYRWSSMGEPRWVKIRWIALGTGASDDAALVVTVAGRAMDSAGLGTVLDHVSPTVSVAG